MWGGGLRVPSFQNTPRAGGAAKDSQTRQLDCGRKTTPVLPGTEGEKHLKEERERATEKQDEARELTSVPVRDQASLAWKDMVSVARQEESRHERPQARWKVGQGA